MRTLSSRTLALMLPLAAVGATACSAQVLSFDGAPGDGGDANVPTVGTPLSSGVSVNACIAASQQPVVLKAFLVPITDSGGPPPSWSVQERLATATPALTSLQGAEWTSKVRFSIDDQVLQLVNTSRSQAPLPNTDEVMDEWPDANVDVGFSCTTTEDGIWQTRSAVLWDFDNSDFNLLDVFFESMSPAIRSCLEAATDVHTALETGSFSIDDATNTMSWRVMISADASCGDGGTAPVAIEIAYVLSR
jgi:hypothetical protein